jgi:hypothetical protein
VFSRACCRTVLLIKDDFFEVVPGIYQVRGYDISVRDGSARRSGQLPGDASDLRKHDVPPRGTPGGVRRRSCLLLTIGHRDLSTVVVEKERHPPDLANHDR